MRGGNGHETLSGSIELGFGTSVKTIENVAVTQLYVFIGMMSTCALVAGLIFLPILRQLDRAGDKIMLQFVGIPPQVRKVLYDTAATRVRLLRRDYGDDEDSGDENMDEEDAGDNEANVEKAFVPKDGGGDGTSVLDDDGVAHDSTLARAFGGGSSVDSGKDGDSKQSSSIFSRAMRSSRKSVNDAPVSFRKSPLAFAYLALRFVSPILLLVVLFSTVYGTFSAQSIKTRSLVSLVVAAGTRASCGRQALVDLQKLSYLTTDANYITRNFFFVMSSLDCVRLHTRLLAYGTNEGYLQEKPYTAFVGTPENGSPSYLSAEVTAMAYEAMFGDACPFIQKNSKHPPSFNMSACREFGNGVLTLGLAATIDLWWQTAYSVGDRQLRGVFTVGDLQNARGWSLPSETFDYSVVKCEVQYGCAPYMVTSPLRTGVLPPTWVSDPNYIGDFLPNHVPGSGVVGVTGMTVPNGTGPYWSGHELNTPAFKFVTAADELYLTPGLLALATLYADDANRSNQAFLQLVALFIPIFMSIFVRCTL